MSIFGDVFVAKNNKFGSFDVKRYMAILGKIKCVRHQHKFLIMGFLSFSKDQTKTIIYIINNFSNNQREKKKIASSYVATEILNKLKIFMTHNKKTNANFV